MKYYLKNVAGEQFFVGETLPEYSSKLTGWVTAIGVVTAVPGEFVLHQELVVPPEQGNLAPTALQFLLMLTAAEQVAIREAAKTDPMVGVLVTMVDDPRLTFVDLTNATVVEGIQYLTTTTPVLLTKDRAARLLKGLGPVAAPATTSESAS